jgi:hypothetical protein
MTLEKATESYSSWLQQLSTKQSEGGPTVYIPSGNDSSDNFTAPTTLSPTTEISSTTVAASHQDLAVQPPVLQTNISTYESLAESHPHNVTVSVNLSTESSNVTEIPLTTTITSSTIPTTTTSTPNDPVALPGSSSLLNNSSVVGSLTAENPTTSSTLPTSSFSPTTKRPSSAYISNDDPDIPWLILKAPEEEFLTEYRPSPAAVDSPLVRPNVPVSVQSPKPSNNPISPSFAELFVDIDIPDRIRDPADTRPLTIHTSKPYPKRKQQLSPAKVQVPPRIKRPNLPGNIPEPPTITDHRHPLLSNKKEPSNGVANLAENNSEVILIDVVLKSPSNKPENTSNDSYAIGEPGKMTSNNSSHSAIKLPPSTTIKASSNNRPNFYKPPLRNPLLTFED